MFIQLLSLIKDKLGNYPYFNIFYLLLVNVNQVHLQISHPCYLIEVHLLNYYIYLFNLPSPLIASGARNLVKSSGALGSTNPVGCN